MQNTNFFIKSIIVYIVTVQLYRLLYNLGHFLILQYESNLFAWIILVIATVLSLWFFRVYSKLTIAKQEVSNLFSFYWALIGISVVNRIVIPEIGEYAGANIENIQFLLYYTTVEAWTFMILNISIVFLYKIILK